MQTADIVQLTIAAATFIVAIATAVGVLVALLAIRSNRQSQREQTARHAHLKYLELALAHPTLAYPPNDIDVANEVFEGSEERFAEYEWLVSFMLSTAAYIWEIVGPRHPLHKLMIIQVAYHWRYINQNKDEFLYLKEWCRVHPAEIEAGIKLGMAHFSEQKTIDAEAHHQ